jgi:hypothetical protein
MSRQQAAFENRSGLLRDLFGIREVAVDYAIAPGLYEAEIQRALAGRTDLSSKFPLLKSVSVPLYTGLATYAPLTISEEREIPGITSFVLTAGNIRWTASIVEWAAL